MFTFNFIKYIFKIFVILIIMSLLDLFEFIFFGTLCFLDWIGYLYLFLFSGLEIFQLFLQISSLVLFFSSSSGTL